MDISTEISHFRFFLIKQESLYFFLIDYIREEVKVWSVIFECFEVSVLFFLFFFLALKRRVGPVYVGNRRVKCIIVQRKCQMKGWGNDLANYNVVFLFGLLPFFSSQSLPLFLAPFSSFFLEEISPNSTIPLHLPTFQFPNFSFPRLMMLTIPT